MTIHLRVTNKIVLEKVRTELDLRADGPTIRELCPTSKAIHFDFGFPVGLLFDSETAALDAQTQGLRFVRRGIYFFGTLCDLYEPDRRTSNGRVIAKALDALRQQVQFNRDVLELIGPALRGDIILEQFGFDYMNQATLHVTESAVYVHLLGVTTKATSFKVDFGVELISRTEYRAAVRTGLIGSGTLLLADTDPLVVAATQSLSVFIPLPPRTVNILMSDMYNRVITEPEDLKHYINHLLLPAERVYVFASLAAILHAYFGKE